MGWEPKRFTREQMEERRLAAVELLRRRKLSQAEIGRRLGVSRETVRKWARILDQKGKRGLRCRCVLGRPCTLTAPQQKQLKDVLKAGALAAGFSTERWTLRRVRQLIKDTFHVHYHFRSLGALLRQLEFSTHENKGEFPSSTSGSWTAFPLCRMPRTTPPASCRLEQATGCG